MAYILQDAERQEMMHALGLSMRRRSYRNHYVVTRGTDAHTRWAGLESKGLAVSKDDGTRLIYFHVTNKGIKALGVDDRVGAENRVADPEPAEKGD